jgi:hypothetical protein
VKISLAAIAIAGCAVDNPAAPAASLDRDYFRCDVQPVLAARCAMPACHGTVRRPLSIYAPGRERYQVGWYQPTAPITPFELDANYGVASGFTTTTATGDAWLVMKPLATSAGGYYHRGSDLFGSDRENVFASKSDAGYQILANWIAGQTATPGCSPTTEVGP